MPQHIDPQHAPIRYLLRIVGPSVVVLGLLFTAVGIGSFFSAFGTFEPPRYFWCAFVGMPLIGVGALICRFAFLGALSRYMANEVAPVGRDVVNYMADGTQGAVRQVAAAIGEGLRTAASAGSAPAVRCGHCQADNEATAKFCDQCGAALNAMKACASCGESNDADARFCQNCGQSVA